MSVPFKAVLLTAFLCLLTGVPAGAAVIFSDNFDASLPSSILNASVPDWSATNGTVDYIKTGGYGISCVGGVGGCIDLDGSTADSADFAWGTPITFFAGNAYSLSYTISGNQRILTASDTVAVTLGSVTVSHTLPGNATFQSFNLFFAPGSTFVGSVVFSNAGGDNIGVILDNVTLESRNPQGEVPEPSTYALVGLGLVAAAFFRRR
jgi:hypothetical protein